MTLASVGPIGQDPAAWPATPAGGLRPLLAAIVVVALAAACAWLLKRGRLATAWRRQPRTVTVERAVPLGDRRSLAIVTVEGRRLLLGLTPVQISLLVELERPPFPDTLARSLDGQDPAAHTANGGAR